ncbi:Laminin subunit alpha, putative [Babesia ovata]|uniref:Laminin subunit alpha, putative n=1 Tax=Babesia ovata TaxID=189622 RepID=A0A2H6KFI7_9APIC|nr:Laminin subunit alpha, putative [Babesia ovata]GBE61763.1 Laminin subunit alpha, putative [Babesia ovata]
MDSIDAAPQAAAEAAASARTDEFYMLNTVSHHSASMEPSEYSAGRTSISAAGSLPGSSRGNEAPRSNASGDHTSQHDPWEGPADNASFAHLDDGKPVLSDAVKYGLEGLLEALKKYPSTHPPIVSQDGVNEELLKERLLNW